MRRSLAWGLGKLAVGFGVMLGLESRAAAWDGEVCIGAICIPKGACLWEPHVGHPIVMEGGLKKVRLRYGSPYQGELRLASPIGSAGVDLSWDLELDWHVYFDDSRCLLDENGKKDCVTMKWSPVAKGPDEPLPIMELMNLRRVKAESTDYFFYKETDYYFWSKDMTAAFGLRPGAMAEVDARPPGYDDAFENLSEWTGKHAYAQGWWVVDQPGKGPDHGHTEIHPLDSLAVQLEDYPARSTYRISAFTNSTIHGLADCSFATQPRVVEWRIPVPSDAKKPNKMVNAQLSVYESYLAGNATVDVEPNGQYVHVSIPMPSPDMFGGLWVGDLRATASDFKLGVRTVPGYPKSVGYFDQQDKPCNKCDAGDVCQANLAKKCQRKYVTQAQISLMPPGLLPVLACAVDAQGKSSCDGQPPPYQSTWSVNGTKKATVVDQPPPLAKPFEFSYRVGPTPQGSYTPVVRLDEAVTTRSVNAHGAVEHAIATPQPQVAVLPAKFQITKKTATELEYEYSIGASANETMAAPRRYSWFDQTPPSGRAGGGLHLGPTLLGHGSILKGTTTSGDAKRRKYHIPMQVSVWDAYRAENAVSSVDLELPQLGIAANVSHDRALDGSMDKHDLVPPLVDVPPHKYHSKWRLTALSAMVRGGKRAEIPVTWPVTYQWTITSGQAYVASSRILSTGAAPNDAFEFTFPSGGLRARDCVSIRLTATDAYGHAPVLETDLCGGLTSAEAKELMGDSRDILAEMERLANMPRQPAHGPIIPDGPLTAVDPQVSAARQLYMQTVAFYTSMKSASAPLSAETLATGAMIGPAIAKLSALQANAFARTPQLARTFYVGTAQQKAAIDRMRGDVHPSVHALYTSGFANLQVAALKQIYPTLGARTAAAAH